MAESDDQIPEAVVEAHRRSRNVSIAILAGSLAIVPLVWAASTLGVDPDIAVWSWVGVMGVGALAYPWRRYGRALSLIQEHRSQQARTELGIDTEATATTEADADPLARIARRIISLAGDDAAVEPLVDSVMARRSELQHDLQSLEEAIAMEASLGDATGTRHGRLSEVAEARRTDLQRLADALRDLHVELTVRSEADHTATVARIDLLLASLSAETELVALGSTAEASAATARSRPEPQRQS